MREQIDGVQQHVDVGGDEGVLAALGGDEHLFQNVGQIDARIDADDAGRALDTVGRAHQRFDAAGIGRVLFELDQPLAQNAAQRLDLLAEHLQERRALRRDGGDDGRCHGGRGRVRDRGGEPGGHGLGVRR